MEELLAELQRSKLGNYFIHFKTKEKQPLFYIERIEDKILNIEVELPLVDLSEAKFIMNAGSEILLDYIPEVDLEDLVDYTIEDNKLKIKVRNEREWDKRIKSLRDIVATFPANPFREGSSVRDVNMPKYIVFGFDYIIEDKNKIKQWKSLSIIERMRLKEEDLLND